MCSAVSVERENVAVAFPWWRKTVAGGGVDSETLRRVAWGRSALGCCPVGCQGFSAGGVRGPAHCGAARMFKPCST